VVLVVPPLLDVTTAPNDEVIDALKEPPLSVAEVEGFKGGFGGC